MNKCANCGLINWANAQQCRRCTSALQMPPGNQAQATQWQPSPQTQEQSWQQPPSQTWQPTNYQQPPSQTWQQNQQQQSQPQAWQQQTQWQQPAHQPQQWQQAIPSPPKKKSGLFQKIDSREDALKTIKGSSYYYFFCAAVNLLFAIFVMPSAILDALVLGVLAGCLLGLKSRVAALLLLGFSFLSILSVFLLADGSQTTYPIWAIVIRTIVGIKSIEATFVYHNKFNSLPTQAPFYPAYPPNQAASYGYSPGYSQAPDYGYQQNYNAANSFSQTSQNDHQSSGRGNANATKFQSIGQNHELNKD